MQDDSTEQQSTGGSPARTIIKVVAVLLIIAALVVLWQKLNFQDLLRQALQWIKDLGALGYVVFALTYILCCVFLIPGSILTLGAGVIYGVGVGTALVSVSSTLGATAAFLVGRHFARGWVSSKIAGNAKFTAVDEAVAEEGWKIVFLTRLSPVFVFNLLNYAYGLTKVSLKHYFFASWIGMIPGTVMYVYLGKIAGDLASLGAGGDRAKTPGEWALTVVGLIATIAVTVYVTKIAKRALDRKLENAEEGKPDEQQ